MALTAQLTVHALEMIKFNKSICCSSSNTATQIVDTFELNLDHLWPKGHELGLIWFMVCVA